MQYEPLRYLDNAKTLLKKSPIENDTYTDVKYVQEGCGTAYLAGDIIRSQKKDVELVLSPQVTTSFLQTLKRIGVSVGGSNTSYAMYGSGTTNLSLYSDMIVKEFLKTGYTARSLGDNISETMAKEKWEEVSGKGIDIVLLGNVNIAATSSSMDYMTGGDWAKTGVNSLTLKGLDTKNGTMLFIISAEYGKAKNASEVAIDIIEMYKDTITGNLKPTN